MDIRLATSLEPSMIVSLLYLYVIFLTYFNAAKSILGSDFILTENTLGTGNPKMNLPRIDYRIPWEFANTVVCVTTTFGVRQMQTAGRTPVAVIRYLLGTSD